MWPFHSTPKLSTEEKIKSLHPGDSWIYSSGMAGIISYHGTSCDICGKEFQYKIFIPSPMPVSACGPYHFKDFGEYKPTRMWYCRSHSNVEIEKRLKELDI